MSAGPRAGSGGTDAASEAKGRKAAFIDRDGVINEDRGYVWRVEDFVFLPGAIEGLKALQDAGYLLVVITNQSGIARGLYTEADYQHLTTHMLAQLAAHRVRIAAVEHCPHLPDAPVAAYRKDCECRKPRPGMILRAAAALGADLAQSILIGDKATDIEAGRAAGVGRCRRVISSPVLRAQQGAFEGDTDTNLMACVQHLLRAATIYA